MTKQDIIKNHWIGAIGEKKYQSIEKSIDSKGVYPMLGVAENIFKTDKVEFYNPGFGIVGLRPKSLSNIENNNGWIKIESQGDLPKKIGEFIVFNSTGQYQTIYYPEFSAFCRPGTGIHVSATHYQPTEKKLPPLY